MELELASAQSVVTALVITQVMVSPLAKWLSVKTGLSLPATVPEYTLLPPQPPPGRFDFGDGAIPLGAPVHGFETVTYKLYQAADGLWYLGLRNSAGVIQPMIGPLNGNTGLRFNYYDGNGAITAVTTSVAQIEIIVRGRTAQPVSQLVGGLTIPVDSITTRVALRNNRRW